jgi:Methyltransferase domain
MPENYFSGRAAERYDELHAPMFESEAVDPAVDFLADLAGQGSALELGIGTGRIALPLAQRGVQVHGIELSEDMVAQLRSKPGADAIDVTIGDFATTASSTAPTKSGLPPVAVRARRRRPRPAPDRAARTRARRSSHARAVRGEPKQAPKLWVLRVLRIGCDGVGECRSLGQDHQLAP